jgi:protein TonB
MTANRPFALSPSMSRLCWTTAALSVIAAHAAAMMLMAPRDAVDDSAGYIAIDLAPTAAGIAVAIANPLPGPPREAQTASQPSDDPEETKPAQSPVAPSPPAADPELRAEPHRDEQPNETARERPRERSARKRSVQVAAVPVATAPPQIAAPPLQSAAAPVAGLSGAAAKAEASWRKDLASRIARYRRYPEAAREHRVEGLVTLQFTVDRAGRVLASRVLESSGSPLLDAEAMAMLQRAAPLPLPPPQAAGASFELVLPIRFAMR